MLLVQVNRFRVYVCTVVFRSVRVVGRSAVRSVHACLGAQQDAAHCLCGRVCALHGDWGKKINVKKNSSSTREEGARSCVFSSEVLEPTEHQHLDLRRTREFVSLVALAQGLGARQGRSPKKWYAAQAS